MRRCDRCGHARAYELADGRFKCKACGQRYTWTTAWASIRLAEATKRRLLELFVLGVPVYRQRFRAPASAPTIERFYRLARACCAYVEELREPFEGAIELGPKGAFENGNLGALTPRVPELLRKSIK